MYDVKFNVKLESGIVECKPFTLEDYTKFLFARSSENSDLIKKWMSDILETNTNAKDLSKHESEILIVNLLAKSLNESDIYQEYVCDCGNEFDVKIDISKIFTNYNDVSIDDLYLLNDFKLSLAWPKLFEDDNVAQMIVNSIKDIYVGDDCIPIDDLSELELNDLYSVITPEDMDKIKNILLSPTIQLAAPIVCPECGKNHVHTISKFKEFIRIL